MKKTVIIAEDNINYIKDIYNMLKENECNIEIMRLYDNGNEALESLKKYEPDFLILNLNLPGKNDIEILEELQYQENSKTKVIAISEKISMINRLNFIKNKMVSNIFVKPFNIQDLYEIIKYEDDDNIKEKECINQILHNFNFNFTSQFYKYLLLCISKALYGQFTLNDIYKSIAKEEKINQDKIKWGIEKLISSMIRYTPKDIIKQYIPYTLNPSVKTFIYEVAKIVEKKLK